MNTIDEFYANLERDLKVFKEKLDKWNPTKYEAKRLKGQLEQTLSSLKMTNGKKTSCDLHTSYVRDKMKYVFLKDNIE